MEYQYTPKEDHSFLASGNLLKHFSGMPCFPVRLNLELFEIVYHRLGKEKLSVYDPCCGSGYSLTVLGMMKQEKLRAIYASDVLSVCREAASCNTAMLTREGLLSAAEKLFQKETTTPERKKQLEEAVRRALPYLSNPALETKVFVHDILQSTPALPQKAEYVFADIPYGSMTEWVTDADVPDPSAAFLQNIEGILADHSFAVLCGTKALKLPQTLCGAFCKKEKLRFGKRLIYLLERKV